MKELNHEKLLRLLADNGKLTHAQLAVMLDSTEDEVAACIADFEKRGIIKGYKTVTGKKPVVMIWSAHELKLRSFPKVRWALKKLLILFPSFPKWKPVT